MMAQTIALVGDTHGFAPTLGDQLAAHGLALRRVPVDGLGGDVFEQVALAIIADVADQARAIDLLQALRRRADLPCIIVLPRGHLEIDRIMALEAGADDWIGQGAGAREVTAHIRAVLRRPTGSGRAPLAAASHGWQLCPRRRDLFDDGGLPRGLTPSEFELLRLLVLADGATLGRDALCRSVFGRNHQPEDRAVDNLVVRLRRKVEPDPRNPQLIRSARPLGYFFAGFPAMRPLVAAE